MAVEAMEDAIRGRLKVKTSLYPWGAFQRVRGSMDRHALAIKLKKAEKPIKKEKASGRPRPGARVAGGEKKKSFSSGGEKG
jgi:hypothetical protein